MFQRLRNGLEKSRSNLSNMVDLAVGRGVYDEEAAEQIEEALIMADIGPEAADQLSDELKEWIQLAGGGVTAKTVRDALSTNIARILEEEFDDQKEPETVEPPEIVILVGVNGTGKTTTAAKLAEKAVRAGETVLLGAADTFRAAAIEQLKIWGERIGADVIAQEPGADPAAVAYDTVQAGVSRGVDRVIIDTAGRLHTKVNLMHELQKVVRVVSKVKKPSEILLVIDATTGQNGILQVDTFVGALPVTGLVITKLDGTARAGMVVQAVKKYHLPIKYIGVGETAEDLLEFDAEKFAEAIVN